MLTLLFYKIFVPFICPKLILLGKIIPIPKNKNKSLCDSDNYRGFALSIFGKAFDWITEKYALCSSDMHFGFKED